MRYDRDFRMRGPRSRGDRGEYGFGGRVEYDFGGRGEPRYGGDYDLAGGGEYGEAYEGPAPRHGWSEGFQGGALRSRGSWNAGARGYDPGELGQGRSGGRWSAGGYEPGDQGQDRSRGRWSAGGRDYESGEPGEDDEFEWGGGYVGGRGYGGTNYDLNHGYATGSWRQSGQPRGTAPREGDSPFSSPATRGGYAWGEAEVSEEYGPARYGYGPYHHRLRRSRRSDDELRQEVEDTLFYDTWVDADAISVQVEEGVVTLSGVLPNYEELRYAVDDAWDVDGVRGVRSQLQVREDSDEVEPGSRGRQVTGPQRQPSGNQAPDPRRQASGQQGREPQRQAPGDQVEDPQRYAPGAPHMHGHPEAGSAALSAGGESGESATAGKGRRGRGQSRSGGRQGSRRGGRKGEAAKGESTRAADQEEEG